MIKYILIYELSFDLTLGDTVYQFLSRSYLAIDWPFLRVLEYCMTNKHSEDAIQECKKGCKN